MGHLSTDQLDHLVRNAEQLVAMWRRAMVPVTAGQLLNALADLAEVLQVTAPSEAAIDLYRAALDTMPGILLRPAIMAVLRTHRFNRLPLPADLIKHIQPDWDLMRVGKTAAFNNLGRFQNALNLRHQNERIHR